MATRQALTRRALLGAIPFSLAAAKAAQWPQWRGPDRDGRSAETALLEVWPDDGPRLIWRSDALGRGYSSISASDGKLITMGQLGNAQFVIALNPETGDEIWRSETGPGYQDHFDYGDGPRSSPTVHEGRVYSVDGRGVVTCNDLETGDVRWSMDTATEFGGDVPVWGRSESPLVDEGRVIVQPGGEGAGIVALNAVDGRVLWTSGSDAAGYASAVVSTGSGVRQYVTLTASAAVSVRASDGEPLWRYERVSNDTANIPTPIVRGDYVFVSTDYGVGCALLHLQAADGGVLADEVYFHRDMRNHYSSCVLAGDTLYGFSARILTAMDFESGEVLWKDRSVGKGQIIWADNRLYVLGEQGMVGLVEANPEAYREISRFEIGRSRNRETWTTPAIANGRLYLRDQSILRCFDIGADSSS